MTNPYGVLGVSPDASDSDIKKAYRDLARKYHPDNYSDNPLADLAQEKMKEINEAYDEIQRQRGGGSSGGRSYPGGASRSGGGTNAESVRIRTAINAGNIALAEELLQKYQPQDAEWNFLMGSLNYRRGWLDDAMSYYQRAVSMNPGSAEYQQALGRMNYRGPQYNPYGGGGQPGGCSACDICTAMLCANMCCQCTV